MCGITGQFLFDPQAIVLPQTIKTMCSQMIHRGPDDEGYYFDRNFGMGMRRLSIVDIKSGHQPICNEDQSLHVVFNGEIYNYRQLRIDLMQKGHVFNTVSDTEVIVHLYEEFGDSCVKYLRGMFAFAIWDQNERRLFLARDHIGKKPLIYRLNNNCLSFGSESRLLLFDGQEKPSLNKEALFHYLSFQYIPSPLSIFETFHKLPAGHTLSCTNFDDIKIQRYWALDFTQKTHLTFMEAKDRLEDLLNEATKIRLMSEVPLGAFLSGGIDSSLIVSLMQRNSSERIKTFTIGFQNKLFDETQQAAITARHLGTEHQTLLVKPDFLSEIPRIVWHFSEPFADPSALPTYFLCQEAKKHITVALCGDGGDENFAGYTRYTINAIGLIVQHLPQVLTRKIIPAMLGLFPDKGIDRSLITAAKNFLQDLKYPPPARNIRSSFFFSDEQKKCLLTENFLTKIGVVETLPMALKWFEQIPAENFLDRCLGYDIAHYLTDNILVKADIASMAHSLELRSPLLDYKVIEFAAQLPLEWKLSRCYRTKHILKMIAADHIPSQIVNSRKRGFTPPIATWFRTTYRDHLQDVLLDPRAINRGYFKKVEIEKLIAQHEKRENDHSKRLWALFILEHWHRVFGDKNLATTRPAEG